MEDPRLDSFIITEKEKGFLIACILMCASDHFYMLPKYKYKYNKIDGIKYDALKTSEIIDLIRKLGCDEDDLEEFISYLN